MQSRTISMSERIDYGKATSVERRKAAMSERIFTEHEELALARKAYEDNARFEVRPEGCALLVIDMQDEFVRPGWTPFWVPEATRQVPRIQRLIDACRKKAIPGDSSPDSCSPAGTARRQCR